MRKLKAVPKESETKISEEEIERRVKAIKEDAAETGRRLNAALREAEKEAQAEERQRRALARGTIFDSANADKERPLPEAANQIIEAHFPPGYDEHDLMSEYRELHDGLGKSFERGEEQWQRAHGLFIRFKVIRYEWEHDNQRLFASMRAHANEELQAEKKQGIRNKAITDADTKAMCAHLFGDEWTIREVRRKKAELTEKSLSNLVDAWASKCGGWRRIDR